MSEPDLFLYTDHGTNSGSQTFITEEAVATFDATTTGHQDGSR